MAQAVRVYLSNQRQGSRKVKARSEVKGSRRKIWRQKGTGRARHGDRYAPIFVGGGVAHGPTGKENFKRKLTKSMRRQALLSALSQKAKDKQVIVVDKLETLKPKTKLMAASLDKVLTKAKYKAGAKINLVLPEVVDSIIRSTRNLPNVTPLQAKQLSTYAVLKGDALVFMKPSLAVLKTALSTKKTNKN